MEAVLEYLREVNTISIIVRLTLATLFAGVIGLERGQKKRPAGFRTHILVCIGATIIMITNQYIIEVMHMSSDPTRLGAQVISGIGFLGAGTIIVDRRNQVKGLTTAAGLWACACMGLAIGIGFYEGAIIACLFLFGVMTGLHKLDLYVQNNSKVINIYAEFNNISNVTNFIKNLKEHGIKISNFEVQKTDKIDKSSVAVIMTLRLLDKINHADCVLSLHNEEGVLFVEEIA